jgi:hypothetical protein
MIKIMGWIYALAISIMGISIGIIVVMWLYAHLVVILYILAFMLITWFIVWGTKELINKYLNNSSRMKINKTKASTIIDKNTSVSKSALERVGFPDGLTFDDLMNDSDINENNSNLPSAPRLIEYENFPTSKTKFGLIDENGVLVIPCEYDKSGKIIIDLIYEEVTGFQDNVAIVKTLIKSENNLVIHSCYGLLDKKGNFIINHYDYIRKTDNDLYVVEKDKKYGAVDKIGSFVIPLIYDYMDTNLSDDKLIVSKLGGKYGILDYCGKIIIPFMYENLRNFSDGLACFEIIRDDGTQKVGYINKKNEIIIPPIYHEGYDFNDGNAEVRIYLDSSTDRFSRYIDIIIDKKGIELERVEGEEEIEDYSENYSMADYPDDSFSHNSYYNDGLDMDQQSKEYWEDLGLY